MCNFAYQENRARRCNERIKRWSRFPEQNGGFAKVDSGFDYAANFSWLSCLA
jgi:hypothetical protein